MTNNRIAGFDLSRALAFLGMLLINFWAMIRENSGPECLNFFYGLIQGRAAATFVVLAGVGLSLSFMRYMGGGVHGIQACRHRLFKRAFFLFGLGMVDSIIWPADILHYYAIYIAIGATLLTASYKRLCLLSILSVAAFSALMMLVHFDRGSDPWVSGFYAFLNLKKMVGHLFFWGNYPVFPWLTFLIIGMWVGRHAGAKTWRIKLLFLGICWFMDYKRE